MGSPTGLRKSRPRDPLSGSFRFGAKGSRGDPHDQIFAGASVHQRTCRTNLASGNMAGRKRSFRLCHPLQEDFHAVWPDCLRSNSGRNAGVALAHAPTAREYDSPTSVPRSACASFCPSRRQGAVVATLSLTREDSTEQFAHGQGESENVPLHTGAGVSWRLPIQRWLSLARVSWWRQKRGVAGATKLWTS